MKTPILIAVVLVSISLLVASCAPGGVGAKPEPAKPQTVADLCKDPSRYVDQNVTLKGVYQGFRAAECRFPDEASGTGVTRSDWLFRTGDDCLYVTGGAPEGIDTLDQGQIGRRLEITARVSRNEAGKFFLKYVEGRLLAD